MRYAEIMDHSVMKIVVVIIALIAGVSACASSLEMVAGQGSTSEILSWKEVAHKYVAENKGWAKEEYELQNAGESDDVMVISVFLYKEMESLAPGGGESFFLHIDPDALEVVRELGTQ